MISLESCLVFILSTIIPAIYCEGDDKLKSNYKHPDVAAERQQSVIIGVVVGLCLACVFLVILCISYNYYKHKPYRNTPRDVEEPLTAMK